MRKAKRDCLRTFARNCVVKRCRTKIRKRMVKGFACKKIRKQPAPTPQSTPELTPEPIPDPVLFYKQTAVGFVFLCQAPGNVVQQYLGQIYASVSETCVTDCIRSKPYFADVCATGDFPGALLAQDAPFSECCEECDGAFMGTDTMSSTMASCKGAVPDPPAYDFNGRGCETRTFLAALGVVHQCCCGTAEFVASMLTFAGRDTACILQCLTDANFSQLCNVSGTSSISDQQGDAASILSACCESCDGYLYDIETCMRTPAEGDVFFSETE